MKKMIALFLALLMIFSLVACGAKEEAPAAKEEETKAEAPKEEEKEEAPAEELPTYDQFVWYTAAADDHPATVTLKDTLAEITEKSNGRITFALHTAGALASEAEAYDMVRMGTVHFMSTATSIMQTYYDPVGALTLPFVFANRDHAYRYYASEEGQKLLNEDVLNATNTRTLSYKSYGFRQLTTKGVSVNAPEDLKGTKIRSMDTDVARFMVECMGGTPVPVAFSELYVAMQTGVVSGQENPIANVIANNFFEVQDNLILTNHQLLTVVDIVNEDTWQTLDPADQQLIADTLRKYAPISDAAVDAYEEEGMTTLEEKGMTINREPDMQAFMDLASAKIQEQYGSNAAWMAIVDDINSYK